MMADKIREIWAWVGVMPDGDEGVLSAKMSGGVVPLIHITRIGCELQRPAAQRAADLGIEVRLVCFTNREDIDFLPAEIASAEPEQGAVQ